jgi:TctA family transporter
MEALGLLMHGFAVLLTWKTLLLMMFGLVLGIFVGVLPGPRRAPTAWRSCCR